MGIIDVQEKVVKMLVREIRLRALNFGHVSNPKAPRLLWDWHFLSCRVETAKHDGGAPAMLKKLRQLNKIGHDIYFRPAQSENEDSIVAYRYFVLDDVPVDLAKKIAAQNRCLLVKTSEEGGCQVWVFTKELLNRRQRLLVQQHFAKKLGCDKGAVSGVQLSRMPGCKNYKRDGQWVNILGWPAGNSVSVAETLHQAIPSEPVFEQIVGKPEYFAFKNGCSIPPQPPVRFLCEDTVVLLKAEIEKCAAYEADKNIQDWRACLKLLKVGVDQDQLIDALAGLSVRKGKQAFKYARRTVLKIIAQCGG